MDSNKYGPESMAGKMDKLRKMNNAGAAEKNKALTNVMDGLYGQQTSAHAHAKRYMSKGPIRFLAKIFSAKIFCGEIEGGFVVVIAAKTDGSLVSTVVIGTSCS